MKSRPNNRGFSGPELCGLEAHEMVAMLGAGEIDAVDPLSASRQRIESIGAEVNATPMRRFERGKRKLTDWRANSGDFLAPGWLGGPADLLFNTDGKHAPIAPCFLMRWRRSTGARRSPFRQAVAYTVSMRSPV